MLVGLMCTSIAKRYGIPPTAEPLTQKSWSRIRLLFPWRDAKRRERP
jgi:hypothetical protein